ncbi:MAG: TetR/AcrR family transcriptional regulator [Gemmatimonadetes bacterium]|nr:TetR/AcrR family transcriptional regulator [Gemmatimonadota bacterium]
MSPRPYSLGRRQAAAAETRAKVLEAARTLLSADEGVAGFSVDAVARAAGVARMTVYYQFGSRQGLMEAMMEAVRERGRGERLAEALERADGLEALDAFIPAVADFWERDRRVVRRLRGLAAMDPDMEGVVRPRDERRRQAFAALLGRLAPKLRPAPDEMQAAADMLYAIVSFETFETLAGPERTFPQVAPLVRRMAHRAVGIPDG